MRYALITGAVGGMGSKTVELFATQGYTVFALDKNVKDATPDFDTISLKYFISVIKDGIQNDY